MGNVTQLLNEAMDKTGCTTKYQLAKTLEIPTQRISEYFSGDRRPDEYACLKISEATGRTFEQVTALVMIEKEKNETRRKAWESHIKRLGGVAASIALTTTTAATLAMTPGTSQAATNLVAAAQTICIM